MSRFEKALEKYVEQWIDEHENEIDRIIAEAADCCLDNQAMRRAVRDAADSDFCDIDIADYVEEYIANYCEDCVSEAISDEVDCWMGNHSHEVEEVFGDAAEKFVNNSDMLGIVSDVALAQMEEYSGGELARITKKILSED